MIDPATGEVVPASVAWAALRSRVDSFIQMEEVPSEIERHQIEAEQLGSALVDFIHEAQNDLDDAKRIYAARLAVEMDKLAERKLTQTIVNKLAEAAAIEELREVHHAQSIYDYARRKLDALKAKHYGLMNRNRTVQGMAGAAHRRGV